MKKALIFALPISIVSAVITVLFINSAGPEGYSFGNWAEDTGLSATATVANASSKGIVNLDGVDAYTDLQELLLPYNRIANIETAAFRDLTNLKTLHLNDNLLVRTVPATFSGLGNLQELKLSNNQLVSIVPTTFCGMRTLQTLYLNLNRLTSLGATTFSGLGNLQLLDLSSNHLVSIDPAAFIGLVELGSITLKGNQLTSIASTTFSGSSNLQEIDLSDNHLTNIESGTFSGLDGLFILKLYDNEFSHLDLSKADFGLLKVFEVDTTGIVQVDLSQATLSQAAFETLFDGSFGLDDTFDLTELTIAGANLSGVDSIGSLANLDELTTLNLSGITWHSAILDGGYVAVIDLITAMQADALSDLTIDKTTYSARQAWFDTWSADEGNTLTVR